MNELKQTIKKTLLIFGDIAILYASLYLTLIIRFGDKYSSKIWDQHLVPFTILYVFWVAFFYINNFYSLANAKNSYKFYASTIKSFLFIIVFSVGFFYFFYSTTGLTPKTNLLLNTTVAFIFFALWRSAYNRFITTEAFSSNVLMLSDENEAREITEKIKSHPQIGYKIIDCSINDIKNLRNFIFKNNIKIIITSNEVQNNQEFLHELYESLSLKIKFENLTKFYEQITGKIPISIIGKIWFLENIKNLDRPIYNSSKRIMDIILSTILTIPAIMLFPFIAIAIKYQDNGPIFYRQKRVGEGGKEFIIIKFRTMKINSEKKGPKFTEKNDDRITKIGKFLRDTRLDELPQIINVVKGDMSFIGPRPERPEFVNDFQKQIPFYNFRHIVKPGLTGWAQVNYEYGDSTKDAYKKLQYDLYYIKNKSLILDIETALKTIQIVINKKGR